MRQNCQKKKKAQGRIPEDAEDTSTSYTSGPLNQLDSKDGTSTKMKNLPIGSKARYDEYNRRGWMQDETSLTPKGSKMRQTDLRRTSNFANISDRNRVPVDEREYNRRKEAGASVTDLFEQHSRFSNPSERIELPKNAGYSNVNQRINFFNKK